MTLKGPQPTNLNNNMTDLEELYLIPEVEEQPDTGWKTPPTDEEFNQWLKDTGFVLTDQRPYGPHRKNKFPPSVTN